MTKQYRLCIPEEAKCSSFALQADQLRSVWGLYSHMAERST